MWHIAPGGAGSDDPSKPVEDLAQLVVALWGVFSNERQIRGDEGPTLRRKRRLGMVFELPCQNATVSELKFITPSRIVIPGNLVGIRRAGAVRPQL